MLFHFSIYNVPNLYIYIYIFDILILKLYHTLELETMAFATQKAQIEAGNYQLKQLVIPKDETMCPGGFFEIGITYRPDRNPAVAPPHNQFLYDPAFAKYCDHNCPKRCKLKKH